MNLTLPYSITIDNTELKIRNECDFRVVLDVLSALEDEELEQIDRLKCALYIFYENAEDITEATEAINEMYNVINMGEKKEDDGKPALMSWEHDIDLIIPPVNAVLGYDVRTPNKYTHWWTFLSAYSEIKDCTFSSVLSIRKKRQRGEKLEDWEKKFMRENPDMVLLPHKLSEEERMFLEFDM